MLTTISTTSAYDVRTRWAGKQFRCHQILVVLEIQPRPGIAMAALTYVAGDEVIKCDLDAFHASSQESELEMSSVRCA